MRYTPGPWFKSGVRFKMNGGEWHSINRYDAEKKADENVACVGYDPRTGIGLADAALIAAAPELLEALKELVDHEEPGAMFSDRIQAALAAIAKAEGRQS